jgi:hypothetical protein
MKRVLFAAVCGFAMLATASLTQVPVNIAKRVRATGQAMDPRFIAPDTDQRHHSTRR